MAMLAIDPAIRPTAGECAELLSRGQSSAPVTVGPLAFQPDYSQAGPGPVTGAASSEEPSTTVVPQGDAGA